LMIRDTAKRAAEMPDALSKSTRSPICVEHLAGCPTCLRMTCKPRPQASE
jgi:hypothetical protein